MSEENCSEMFQFRVGTSPELKSTYYKVRGF
jgi:hypothetical protein